MVQCGGISNYNATSTPLGPRREWTIITKRIRWEGFVFSDYQAQFPEAVAQLTEWVEQGKLQHRLTIEHGFESIVDAFLGLFDGSNIGKMLVKL